MKTRSLTTGVVALFLLLTSSACGATATEQGALARADGPTSTAPDLTTTTEAPATTTSLPATTTTMAERPEPTAVDSMFGGPVDDHNDGERPTVAEMKEEITGVLGAQADQPGVEEIIDCLAQGYYDSDLPNGVLEKVVAGEDAEVDMANEDAYNQISDEIQEQCLGTGN